MIVDLGSGSAEARLRDIQSITDAALSRPPPWSLLPGRPESWPMSEAG